MNNDAKKIFETNKDQKTIENMIVLEIGKVTQLTLGQPGYFAEGGQRPYPNCVILKK